MEQTIFQRIEEYIGQFLGPNTKMWWDAPGLIIRFEGDDVKDMTNIFSEIAAILYNYQSEDDTVCVLYQHITEPECYQIIVGDEQV